MHCLLNTKETEPDLIGIQVLLHGCYKYICIHSLVKLYFSTSASKQICTIPYAVSVIQSSNIFWSSQIPWFGSDQFLKWKLAISRVYWSWHNLICGAKWSNHSFRTPEHLQDHPLLVAVQGPQVRCQKWGTATNTHRDLLRARATGCLHKLKGKCLLVIKQKKNAKYIKSIKVSFCKKKKEKNEAKLLKSFTSFSRNLLQSYSLVRHDAVVSKFEFAY